MAFYAMSDLHGMYDKYREMLALIRFSEEDELFILGDVVDRGSKPMEILLDMMQRPNIYPLYGNHDVMAQKPQKRPADSLTRKRHRTFSVGVRTAVCPP